MSELEAKTVDPDDPELTAFALGELDAAAAERYAALVQRSTALQLLVQEIQAEARVLREELQLEPSIPLSPRHREAILSQAVVESPLTQQRQKALPRNVWLGWMPIAASTVAVATVISLSLPRPRSISTTFDHTPTAAKRLADTNLAPEPYGWSEKTSASAPLEESAESKRPSRGTAVEYESEKTIAERAPGVSAELDTLQQGKGLKPATWDRGSSPLNGKAVPLSDLEAPGDKPKSSRSNENSSQIDLYAKAQPASEPAALPRKMPEEAAGGSEIRPSVVPSDNRPNPGKLSAIAAKDSLAELEKREEKAITKGKESGQGTQRSKESVDWSVETNDPSASDPTGSSRSREKLGKLDSRNAGSQDSASAKNESSNRFGTKYGRVAESAADKLVSKSKSDSPNKADAHFESKLGQATGDSSGPQVASSPAASQKPSNGSEGKPFPGGNGSEKRNSKKSGDDKSDLKADATFATIAGLQPKPGASQPIERFDESRTRVLDDFSLEPGESKLAKDSSKREEVGKKELRDEDTIRQLTEKTEGFEGSKKREVAFLELRRALESERLKPGSVPLDELQRLERQSQAYRKPQGELEGSEAYQPIYENSFLLAAKEQQSTFSIDVDSASYANVRRFLQSRQAPPADAVRIEELVNYFAYQYPAPEDRKPFSVNTDIAACPWNPAHHLVRIGLKGREIPKDQRPPSSLVFLVDVSGSMAPENKLPLVRSSLKTLVSQLDERDRIAIVTYAGEAGVKLPATSVSQKETILAAIDSLGAGGSTNGAAGINTAYDIAAKEFIEKGTNRVILCTDGDFNVGVTSDEALVQMIQARAKSGVFLSIFGFGMGNLKDAKLEQLADKGNGQYGYIDDRLEAEKVFVQELSGTLVTIAKDVKIQIDFNPEVVNAYRLIGYENRVLATEDFHNDKKDAGEIGAGHTVTALYEIIPSKELKADDKTRWMTVKLRYKQPEASVSELIENPLTGVPGQLKLASTDFQFAASVTAFGMLLRNSQHAGQANWAMVKELAQTGLSHDPFGHRAGFLRLVLEAESLIGERRPSAPPEPDSTVNGKYKSLLRRLNVPEDAQKYGQFNDYGFDGTKAYGGAENLPEGYWVYVAPYWYIWGETARAEPK